MPSHYTYKFGSLGKSLDSTAQSEFFQWFHLQPEERRIEAPCAVVRHRPSGATFHDVCALDVWIGPAGELVRMELSLLRTFINGPDRLFAQDLVKSFLHAVLPDACRDTLPAFMKEICNPSAPGRTPGYKVYLGRKSSWRVQTGWSRLRLANTASSLTVQVMPTPQAPNASRISDAPRGAQRLLASVRTLFGLDW